MIDVKLGKKGLIKKTYQLLKYFREWQKLKQCDITGGKTSQ